MQANRNFTRPVVMYFVLVFLVSTMLTIGRWGWYAPLWALLALVIFAVPIPAPIFAWHILKQKGLERYKPQLLRSFALSFAVLIPFFSVMVQSVVNGILLAVVCYGYPGIVVLVISIRLKSLRPH